MSGEVVGYYTHRVEGWSRQRLERIYEGPECRTRKIAQLQLVQRVVEHVQALEKAGYDVETDRWLVWIGGRLLGAPFTPAPDGTQWSITKTYRLREKRCL